MPGDPAGTWTTASTVADWSTACGGRGGNDLPIGRYDALRETLTPSAVAIVLAISAGTGLLIPQRPRTGTTYSDPGVTRLADLEEGLMRIHTGETVAFCIARYGLHEGHTAHRADPVALAGPSVSGASGRSKPRGPVACPGSCSRRHRLRAGSARRRIAENDLTRWPLGFSDLGRASADPELGEPPTPPA